MEERSDGLPVFIIREKHQSHNQEKSDLVNQDHNLPGSPQVTRPDQDQNFQIHEQTSTIEVTEGSPRDECVISIREKLEQAHRDNTKISEDNPCIYRIPHYLRENGNKSYFPQTVSVGPYHHGKKRLRFMERHKWRVVDMVLKRRQQGFEMYIDAMKKLEKMARACYEGPIGLSSKEFTEMLVLDGCFVLELFRGADQGFSLLGYPRNDPVFAMRGPMNSIQCDMIMMENQLPLFVLNRLLELQLGTQYQTIFVAQLAVRFFAPLMPTPVNRAKDPLPADIEMLHCLDVFRRSLFWHITKPEPRLSRRRWSWKTPVKEKRQQQLINTVTELRETNINFKTSKLDPFWNIRYKNGCLEIPKLLIHEGSKSLFLNLVAFEQCHINSNNDFTSYIIFMDNLIDTPEDVRYLHNCGIIEHWLGNDSEVAEMFNQLCKDVNFDLHDSYLSKLSNDVHRYYNRHYCLRKWNFLMKTLKEKYFDSPWAYISFFAAVFLLLLTLSQSYFAAYAYYMPNS